MRPIGDSLGVGLIALGAVALLVGWLWLHWDDGPRESARPSRADGVLHYLLFDLITMPLFLAIEGVAHGFKNWPKKAAPLATLVAGIGMIVGAIARFFF